MHRLTILLLIAIISFRMYASTVITLDKAIKLGLNNSKELTNKELKLNLAVYNRKLSRREWFPSLGINYQNNDSVTVDAPDTHSKSINLDVTQMIFDGGSSAYRYKLAGKQLKIESDKLISAKQQLRTQIWSEYSNILIMQMGLEIREASYKSAQNEITIMNLKAKQGSITKLELLEAEISIKQLKLEIININNQIDDQYFKFKTLLNIPTTMDITLVDSLYNNYIGFKLPWDLDEYKGLSLKNNTEFNSAALEVEKKQTELFLTKLKYLPTLKLKASIGVSGDEYPLTTPTYNLALDIAFNNISTPTKSNISIGESGDNTLNRGLSVGASPFEVINGSISRKEIEVDLDSSLYKLNKLKESIPYQAEKLYSTYNLKKQELTLQKELISLEEDRLKILEKKFFLGTLIYSDWDAAKNKLKERHTEYLKSIIELLNHETQISFLIGMTPDQLDYLRRN